MPPLTRRDFMLAVGAGLLPALQACGGGSGTDDEPPLDTATFTHGVASGDPWPDAVVLWTRALPPAFGNARVRYRLARDPAMSQIVVSGTANAEAARDHTVKVDVAGLDADSAYYYQFESATGLSDIGRTRTAPAGDVARLRLAFVTCANFAAGFFHAYRRVAERPELHAVVHLGDYIYENGNQDEVRPHEPSHPLVSLTDYRKRYAQYRGDADLQELHRQHPMIWVWDDHEICNNAWRDGAEAHDPETQGTFDARRLAAMQAAFEWMPIRPPDTHDPARIWRSFNFGSLADLTMLDTRHFGRVAPLPPNTLFGEAVPVFTQTGGFADGARQLLGSEQEAWLASQIAGSTARWQLIGNQVYFSPLKLVGTPLAAGGGGLYLSTDKWDGYGPARDRVVEMLSARDNVVIMTGDAHEAYAFEVTSDPNGAGYRPLTGSGACAVEFVATSITSRGDLPVGNSATAVVTRTQAQAEQLLRLANPHLHYYQNTLNGYVLLDLTADRLQCQFWTVPHVAERTDAQALDRGYIVESGSHRLVTSWSAMEPIAGAPLPAP